MLANFGSTFAALAAFYIALGMLIELTARNSIAALVGLMVMLAGVVCAVGGLCILFREIEGWEK